MELYYLCIDFVFQFIVEKYRNKVNQIKSNRAVRTCDVCPSSDMTRKKLSFICLFHRLTLRSLGMVKRPVANSRDASGPRLISLTIICSIC